MYGKIIGTGSYIPNHVVENEDLKKCIQTEDAWIQERTGIARRHLMESETTKDMAVNAGKRAMEDAGIAKETIEMVIVCSVSADILLPNTACYVQEQLGLKNAMCFDVNAACTGFIVAYNTVQAYIHAGLITTALIIAAEGLSQLVDWTDRGTCILFGDGAGATVISADEQARFNTVMHSDGTGGKALTCEQTFALRKRAILEDATMDNDEKGMLEAQDKENCKQRTYIGMDGQEVFRFAVKKVPAVIQELLNKMNKEEADIDCFLLHQANERIIQSIAKRIGTTRNKVPMNLREYGNTSSASIPILLDEVAKQGKIKRGDRIIMSGFGAGLSWAATYMEF